MKISDEDRQRAIKKIKKCLALGASSEPHEAAAAIRQAQKLMSSLGLTEDDLAQLEIKAEVVKTKEAFGGCAYLAHLTRIIQVAFGVAAVWEPGNGVSRIRANIRYIGPSGRVALAVYAHKVIDKAVREGWAEYLDEPENYDRRQKPGARAAFRGAFLTGVEDKVMAISPTESEQQAIARYQAAMYGTGLTTQEDKYKGKLDFDAYCAGAEKAQAFQLNRPLAEDKKELLAIEHQGE